MMHQTSGAVMFLFEGEFGNIFHAGDSRLTPDCLQNLPEKYFARRGCDPNCRLDFVYLDCTFGKYYQSIPSKHSAIRQVMIYMSSTITKPRKMWQEPFNHILAGTKLLFLEVES